MHRVAIVAIPEALPYSMFGPLDVLRACGFIAPATSEQTGRFHVDLIGLRSGSFQCYNGVTLTPDTDITHAMQYDLIWIPSLVLGPEGLINRHSELIRWLRAQANQGAEIASVCTGTFLLAETGLLDKQSATTHWRYADLFQRLYPGVLLQPHLTLVDNDTLYCAGAGAAWHDMVLLIMEKKCGKKCAVEAAKMFLLQTHPQGQQHLLRAQHVSHHQDAAILKAERWLTGHLAEEQLISRVAAELGLSESAFSRRFKQATQETPQVYVQRLRIEKAKEALELTKQPIEEISYLVGYQDSSFFRRLFKRLTGLSPNQYRKQFSL